MPTLVLINSVLWPHIDTIGSKLRGSLRPTVPRKFLLTPCTSCQLLIRIRSTFPLNRRSDVDLFASPRTDGDAWTPCSSSFDRTAMASNTCCAPCRLFHLSLSLKWLARSLHVSQDDVCACARVRCTHARTYCHECTFARHSVPLASFARAQSTAQPSCDTAHLVLLNIWLQSKVAEERGAKRKPIPNNSRLEEREAVGK